MTKSPYKLLDYYTYEDKDLFFGREEETRKMVGEILSTRLLVLFSPSGSGKTSLINAGVRPQLDEMGYKTIYTRLEDEPIPSVCNAVSQALKLPPGEKEEDLYEFMKRAAQTAGQPLVIFLDQFEEFFIVFRNHPEIQEEFIKEIARIRYDSNLPVSFVFSLRDDYYGQLQELRKHIPSINNSNIWLRPFSEDDAKRAIEGPIEAVGWKFEEGMVDTLLKDLEKGGRGIEPIILQIVCSHLWEERGDHSREIPLSTYEKCGRMDNIVHIFTLERLEKIPRQDHKLMIKLFEALKTPDNTKRFRPIEDLQSQLKIRKPRQLKSLLDKLHLLNILRLEKQKGTDWYEFKHDYLVPKISEWIKINKERKNRKRLVYAATLPVMILLLGFLSYFFIQYHTFFATFTQPENENLQEEIVIVRGFNPFNESITTGLFISDIIGQSSRNVLRSKLKISFWDKNNWTALVNKLSIIERGRVLYRMGQTKAGTEILKEALKDSEPYIRRRQATEALGRLGKVDNTVIQALKNALNDSDSDVQQQANEALARLGESNKTAIEALINALVNPDFYIRRQAAEALGQLGKADSTVIRALRIALRDPVSSVRRKAAESLGLLGKADKTVSQVLINDLLRPGSLVRKETIESLERLGIVDNNVIQALINALKDSDSYVRRQAAEALGRIGKTDSTVIQALRNALNDSKSHVRRKAAEALGRLGNADKTVIQELRNALKDSKSYVRLQAAEALGRLGNADKTVIQTLINALKDKDSGVRVRRQAVEALVQLGYADNTGIQALINALKDSSSYVRLQAAEALVRLGNADNTGIQELRNALKDENPFVRLQAAVALGRLGYADNTGIQTLINALKSNNSDVQRLAAEALGRLGTADKTVIQELINALKDEDSDARRKAAEALGTLYKDKSETELMELLQRPDSGYRTTAAHALAQQKTISSRIRAEINRLKDHDERPWVRLAAWDAFELIQARLKSEKRAKQYIDEGDKTFSNGEFWRANFLHQNAFESIEKYIDLNHEKAAHIKFQQARCTAKLNRLVDTLEYLESAFKYNPALKERVKNELAKDDSEWTLIKDNWYLKEVLLKD